MPSLKRARPINIKIKGGGLKGSFISINILSNIINKALLIVFIGD